MHFPDLIAAAMKGQQVDIRVFGKSELSVACA